MKNIKVLLVFILTILFFNRISAQNDFVDKPTRELAFIDLEVYFYESFIKSKNAQHLSLVFLDYGDFLFATSEGLSYPVAYDLSDDRLDTLRVYQSKMDTALLIYAYIQSVLPQRVGRTVKGESVGFSEPVDFYCHKIWNKCYYYHCNTIKLLDRQWSAKIRTYNGYIIYMGIYQRDNISGSFINYSHLHVIKSKFK